MKNQSPCMFAPTHSIKLILIMVLWVASRTEGTSLLHKKTPNTSPIVTSTALQINLQTLRREPVYKVSLVRELDVN